MTTRPTRRLTLFATTLLALALLGCAGSGTTVSSPVPGPQQPGRPEPRSPLANRYAAHDPLSPQEQVALSRRFSRVLPPQTYSALQHLGAVGQTLLSAGGSQTGVSAPLKQVSTALPWQIAGNEQYGGPGGSGWITSSADVVFNAAESRAELAPAGPAYPDNFSYVIYRVDAVTQTPLTLALDSSTSADLGIAVYNWAYGSAGRWEPVFYGAPQGDPPQPVTVPLELVPGADWTNANNDLAIVVFCLAPNAVNVNGVALLDYSLNIPPDALLTTSPESGQAPLSVQLSGALSGDVDGTLVKYRFDPLGDGSWIDNGADSELEYTYTDPGVYLPVVEVTDDFGATETDAATLIVAPLTYDEIEHNDSTAQANDLPAIPFKAFSGNVGLGGNYDGDEHDYFTFDAGAGDLVNFVVQSAPSATLGVSLQDSTGWTLASNIAPYPVVYEFDGTEPGPFYLVVENISGIWTDYYIDAYDVYYHEVEDNDSAAQANWWGDLEVLHSFSDFTASLGSGPGYDGYDGDSADWYTFELGAGWIIDLTLDYDDATGDIGVSLFDGNAQLLVNSADGDGSESISFTVQPDTVLPLLVQIAGSGYSDYYVSGTAVLPNPGYSEQEDNDDYNQPNALPPVPFSGFTGNVGWEGVYDGDYTDYFSFSAVAGDRLTFTVTPADPGQPVNVYLHDATLGFYSIGGVNTDPGTGVVTANAVIRGGATAPFFLIVDAGPSAAADYTITGAAAGFSEVEDNDDNAQANALPGTTFGFFSGHVGSGGPHYDGDSLDVFSFSADEGDKPSIFGYYDILPGQLGGLIKDSEGDIIGEGTQFGGGTVAFETYSSIGPGDLAPFYLELAPDFGHTYYWLERWQ
jgi:hypothetical protein